MPPQASDSPSAVYEYNNSRAYLTTVHRLFALSLGVTGLAFAYPAVNEVRQAMQWDIWCAWRYWALLSIHYIIVFYCWYWARHVFPFVHESAFGEFLSVTSGIGFAIITYFLIANQNIHVLGASFGIPAIKAVQVWVRLKYAHANGNYEPLRKHLRGTLLFLLVVLAVVAILRYLLSWMLGQMDITGSGAERTELALLILGCAYLLYHVTRPGVRKLVALEEQLRGTSTT